MTRAFILTMLSQSGIFLLKIKAHFAGPHQCDLIALFCNLKTHYQYITRIILHVLHVLR